MREEQVDAAEDLAGLVDLGPQPVGLEVGAVLGKSSLGRDDDVGFRVARVPGADEALARPAAVDVGAVDDGDPELERAVDQGTALFFVEPDAGAGHHGGAAEVAGAEDEPRDGDLGGAELGLSDFAH